MDLGLAQESKRKRCKIGRVVAVDRLRNDLWFVH